MHAALGALTLGMSPVSLVQAWQDWILHLAISPGKQQEIFAKGIEKIARLWGFADECAHATGQARRRISPLPQDRRFNHPGWQLFPFNIFEQDFLLWQQWWHNATTGVPGVSAKHERLVEFYSRQFLDMFAPSNFLPTNPEVLEKTLQEGGANLIVGMENLIDDLMRRTIDRPPTGTEEFRPGVDVAVTPGDVVFRNELIELIRFRPLTPAVHAEPLLIVPAWIMKYYILDLSPKNSLIRYLVEQGFCVYCISWRNPGAEQRDLTLDDYRRLGVMDALEVVSGSSDGARVHGVGYCLGGTLLSIAAAAMARDGDDRFKSLSFFAAQMDFEEPGELGHFIDESQIQLVEDVMWSEGYLDQRRMAGAFQMLRSQDLVWSRMVHDYLMGERAPMSDLMAWNADATRMPYRMHSEYLRRLYLGNDLAQGRFPVDGHPVHLESITAPVFAVGTLTDHVAPWRSVFKMTRLLHTDIDFVLTNGGHNAGIVAEPGHPRRAFRHLAFVHGTARPDADRWMETTEETKGSWWPTWAGWLRSRSGASIAARDTAGAGLEPICPAPGKYVLTS